MYVIQSKLDHEGGGFCYWVGKAQAEMLGYGWTFDIREASVFNHASDAADEDRNVFQVEPDAGPDVLPRVIEVVECSQCAKICVLKDAPMSYGIRRCRTCHDPDWPCGRRDKAGRCAALKWDDDTTMACNQGPKQTLECPVHTLANKAEASCESVPSWLLRCGKSSAAEPNAR